MCVYSYRPAGNLAAFFVSFRDHGENDSFGVFGSFGRVMKSVLGVVICLSLPPAVCAQIAYEREPILYSKTEATDPIAKFIDRIEAGDTELDRERSHGYLRSLLNELKIPVSSQTLVFSKTSLQRSRISPRTPRAIYFNDDVYVAWVNGGDVIEISAADSRIGAVFYRLDQSQRSPRPKITRETDDCLSCHGSTHTRRVPGHIMRSVYPEPNGLPRFSAGTFRTDDTSKFRERYGGWYVTGTHGDLRHMGNQTHTEDDEGLDLTLGANLTDVRNKFNAKQYISQHSDIVALMVLAHQTAVHNAMTTANFNARRTIRDARVMNKALEREPDFESESTKRRFKSAAEDLVEAILFVDEFKLTSQIKGSTSFADEFAKRGPFDKRGRSLRHFDLQSRLFKHPCSFLIYSDAFAALPPRLLEEVWKQMKTALSLESDARFSHLSARDKQAIREILSATLPQSRDALAR